MRPILLTLLAVLLLYVPALAQLEADFAPDKEGGCSPLLVQFTNTTKGASATASYRWDFGNGSSSALQNAGAIFQQEKTYTVTLTVTDGNRTSTKSRSVSVYKKPEVDFSVSLSKGCLPLPVQFTGNAKAGDGTISSYHWDFGDGEMQSAATNQLSHTYTSAQKAGISLTVTNSFGCYATTTRKEVIDILPALSADFRSDKTVLCKETDSVQFTNQSKGPGAVSYAWNFGDGSTSTLRHPAHAFNKRGAYTVSLTVKNNDGCTATKTVTDYLNVANYKTVFEMPALICRENYFTLTNQSTPNADSFTWELDGSFYSDYLNSPTFVFHRPGTHKVKLTSYFGTCVDSATASFTVKDIPPLTGFIADIKDKCGAPAKVAFQDTTKGAVKWEWDFDYRHYGNPVVKSTLQAPIYTYTNNNYQNAFLRVTNADGCTNSIWQNVPIMAPQVFLLLDYISGDNIRAGCDSLTIKIRAQSNDSIVAYKWDFGDGNTSTEAAPIHTYRKEGRYVATLHYTTANGCTGTVYHLDLNVLKRPKADFISESGTTICGQSPVTFQRTTESNWNFDHWIINGNYYNSSYYSRYEHRFTDTGKYTITHVVYNDGCRDTVTKENYITVLYPFAQIKEVKNTCDGDRGLITFTQRSNPGEKWVWDFGDGQSTTATTEQLTVSHQYLKTGKYQAMLSVTSGACTVSDSITVYVMKKQSPVLSAAKTTFCADEPFYYTLSKLEQNPYPYVWVNHHVTHYEYGDGSVSPHLYYYDWDHWIRDTTYNGRLLQLQKGQDKIRIITNQVHFNCPDTSNYVPIKIVGAVAGFEVLADKHCYSSPVTFKDTSNSYNTKITSWEWNFGDGTSETVTQSGTVSHLYSNPGHYPVRLKINDTSGCVSTSDITAASVEVYGPKAAFTASGTNVALNTTIYFHNQSNIYRTYDVAYAWDFGDGSPLSTVHSPTHTYTKAGTYTVKLIASSAANGCRSEATQVIVVKNFNSAFGFTTSYLPGANCPPVVARFTNTSLNYTHVRWDFGDGFTAENVNHPSHIYEKPGKYFVTLHVFAPNGVEGKYVDSIVVTKPAASLHTNLLQSCTSETVKLTARGDSSLAYWWDFGDGKVQRGTDSVVHHFYSTAGVYNPKLMLTDANGCTTSVTLDDTIIIDSLSVKMNPLPSKICTPKEIFFQSVVNSSSGQTQFTYHWNFGTGTASDTSNKQHPQYTFTRPGKFPVRLTVTTNTGCKKEITETVSAFEGLGAAINGPAEVCQGADVQFRGTTLLPGQPQWKWIFHDGTTVSTQNAPVKKYPAPGEYAVQLVVNNNGCEDTVKQQLKVHPNPVDILKNHYTVLCEGSTIALTASGAQDYQWFPSTGLNTTTSPTVIASPANDVVYRVTAITEKGCSATDSIRVRVVHPMVLSLANSISVCTGNAVELKASGAASYQWIRNTTGLNNVAIANPVARPTATTSYTVVGTDADRCFSDTATINVVVNSLPMVDAGPEVEVLAGTATQLKPVTGTDVTGWNWTPADFLSCTTCPAPETKPLRPLTYTLTVRNASGCTASDTVAVKLLCSGSRIFVPTVFTPNNDGKNDRFRIKAEGIKQVKLFRIFNRWGELVFERTHFSLDDDNAAWDGKQRGVPVPEGTYVYFAELTCNEAVFQQKGTITVVR